MITGLKQIAQDGIGPFPVAAIGLGLLVGALFLRRQRRLADPLIDLALFRVPAFNVSLATNVLTIFIAVGYFLFIAQYLQLVLVLSPLQAGLWSLPSAVGFIVGSNVAPKFIYRYRPALILGPCLAIAALGLLMLTQIGATGGLATVVGASVLISLSLAPVFSLTTELIVGSAPPERAGAASGISETGAELGGALGIATLGSVGTAIYRSQLAERLPAGLSAEATAVARDTLGAAVALAETLPQELSQPLLEVSREAFVRGVHVVAAIAAVVAIGAALLVLVALRREPARGEAPAELTHGEASGGAGHAAPIDAVPGGAVADKHKE
jgi:DHA2 family multidrug resistance protein-like MFS transporter